MDDPVAIEGDNSVAIVFARLKNAEFQFFLRTIRNLDLSASWRHDEPCPGEKQQQDNPTRKWVFKTAHDGALT